MRTRRVWMCLAVAGACAGLVVAAARETDSKTRDAGRDTIVHSVYFWLKPEATKADAEALARDCKTMLGPLDSVKQLDVGPPLGKSRGAVDGSYQVGLVVYFADQAGCDTYLKHPDHLKLVAKYKDRWQKVVVYDFVRK